MDVKKVVVIMLVVFGVMAGVSFLMWRFSGSMDGGQVQVIEDIAGDMRHTRGEGEVVITEFSDFQCPACRAAQPLLESILSEYDGRVRLVYRHYPLTGIHKRAEAAAEASEAAGEQGKFFEYHDMLFARQRDWSSSDETVEIFAEYAKELELDVEKFLADIERDDLKEIVQRDSLYASRVGLTGTPSFFVNGEKVESVNLKLKISEILE